MAFRAVAVSFPRFRAACVGSRPHIRSNRERLASLRPSPGCRRPLHVAPFLMPPLLFSGLFVALWCWKCAMMVLFQNAIIYNPFLPPNARSMTIDEVSRDCGRIKWREERIKSLDGTEIALCVADVPSKPEPSTAKAAHAYILYFQGSPISSISHSTAAYSNA